MKVNVPFPQRPAEIYADVGNNHEKVQFSFELVVIEIVLNFSGHEINRKTYWKEKLNV